MTSVFSPSVIRAYPKRSIPKLQSPGGYGGVRVKERRAAWRPAKKALGDKEPAQQRETYSESYTRGRQDPVSSLADDTEEGGMVGVGERAWVAYTRPVAFIKTYIRRPNRRHGAGAPGPKGPFQAGMPRHTGP